MAATRAAFSEQSDAEAKSEDINRVSSSSNGAPESTSVGPKKGIVSLDRVYVWMCPEKNILHNQTTDDVALLTRFFGHFVMVR